MDSFDAPMLDYSGDMDVHMQTTVSSPKPWIQPETIMEEDVHTIHLPNPFPSHLPQQDVEIDMDDYYNENVEYEMADGEIAVVDTELVDIDVYDATREEAASVSVSISHPAGHTDQDISKEPTAVRYLPSESEVVATTDHIPPISNLEPALHQSAEPELLTPTPLQATVGQDHDTNPSDPADAAIALQESALPLAADTKDPHSNGEAPTALERHTGSPRVTTADADVDNVTVLPLDDAEQKGELEFSPTEPESSTSVPQNVTPGAAVEGSHQAEIQDSESHGGVRIPDESYDGGVLGPALDSAEAGEPERPAVESHETEEDDADPHEISEGVYIEPPPPVLIELPLTSNQPVCSLFNLPSADTGVTIPTAEASYTILLQNRPTLYYETLNDFFDALREEEPIQTITEFADGEIVIDAYDLQLVISEVIAVLFSSFDAVLTVSKQDNVHAREISLHDLNVLHHGLDLIGPLRLRLRTVLPRFINRYRGLQSQVTRLDVARSASHSAEDVSSEEQAFVGSRESLWSISLRVCDKRLLLAHQRNSVYDHALNHDEQTEREPTGDDGHEKLAGGVDEREDVGSTYLDHADYQDENGEADYDESEQYDDAQEHPQVPEDEVDAHEETDQFVTNDEPEPLPDVDPTHKGSADPESTEYRERDDGHEEGDAEVTSTITASTHADDTGFHGDELRVLTVTGAPQIEEIDGEFVFCREYVPLSYSMPSYRPASPQHRTFDYRFR